MSDLKPILPLKACPRPVPSRPLALAVFILLLAPVTGIAQTLTGTWALSNGSDCATTETTDEAQGPALTKNAFLVFHENQRCELTGLDLFEGKPIPNKALLFKHEEGLLYFLDKRSQTIASVFTIEKLSADSLILSDTHRPCLTKIFIRRQRP